jgi:hypothetical protein
VVPEVAARFAAVLLAVPVVVRQRFDNRERRWRHPLEHYRTKPIAIPEPFTVCAFRFELGVEATFDVFVT